jgi:hypothetical protein
MYSKGEAILFITRKADCMINFGKTKTMEVINLVNVQNYQLLDAINQLLKVKTAIIVLVHPDRIVGRNFVFGSRDKHNPKRQPQVFTNCYIESFRERY